MLLELNVRLFSVKSYYMYKKTTSETEGEFMHEKLVCPQVIFNRSFKGGSLVVVRCCMFFVSEFRWHLTLRLFYINLVRFRLLSGHFLRISSSVG